MSSGLTRTAALLREVPPDRPVSLLLRHAARVERPGELPDSSVTLTDEGIEAAGRLGRLLSGRLRAINTSPVLRCRATAALLAQASGMPVPRIVNDHLLGAPGIFVINEGLASETWAQTGHASVLDHLCSGVGVLPGLADPAQASSALLRHLYEVSEAAGLSIFVTHDSVLGPALRRWFAPKHVPWPDYLDAVAIWGEHGEVVMRYLDHDLIRC